MNTTVQPLYTPTLGSNFRALAAVAIKDWRHFWRYPLSAITFVIQPLIWLFPVYFMGMAFSTNGKAQGFAAYSGTTDYMSFVLLGTALANFIGAVFWGMGFSLKGDMDTGVLESNWLTPVSRFLLLVGRTFTSLVTTTIVSLVMLMVAGILFGFHPTGNVLAAVLTALPMLVGLYGFGFAFASLVLILREANTMVDISSFLVQVFSGSMVPVNALPRWLFPIAVVIPLTYGFDAVRGWLLRTRTLLPLYTEIVILVIFMVVMTWAGMFVFNKVERRVRQLGTLGQH
jgi:ABC-2 type transport system permease protein